VLRVQVVEHEAQREGEVDDLVVRGVDELAPALGDLAAVERATLGPAAAADTGCGLEHGHVHARLR